MFEADEATARKTVSMEGVVDYFARLTHPGDLFCIYFPRDMFEFIRLLSIIVRCSKVCKVMHY